MRPRAFYIYSLFLRLSLILLYFLCAGGVTWGQGTGPRPYWSEPTYKVSAPPSFWSQSERAVRSSKSRTTAKTAAIQFPDPKL